MGETAEKTTAVLLAFCLLCTFLTTAAVGEDSFFAAISLKRVTEGELYYGDQFTVGAEISCANMSCSIAWERQTDEKWEAVAHGEKYTFALNADNARRNLRVTLVGENGESITSSVFTMPAVTPMTREEKRSAEENDGTKEDAPAEPADEEPGETENTVPAEADVNPPDAEGADEMAETAEEVPEKPEHTKPEDVIDEVPDAEDTDEAAEAADEIPEEPEHTYSDGEEDVPDGEDNVPDAEDTDEAAEAADEIPEEPANTEAEDVKDEAPDAEDADGTAVPADEADETGSSPAAQNGMIILHSSIEDAEYVYEGEEVTLTAEIVGLDNTEYTLQWYVSTDGGDSYEKIDDADGAEYVYEANEDSICWIWKLTLVIGKARAGQAEEIHP